MSKKKMTMGQTSVYETLKKYGPLPDHALVPIMQHVVGDHQSSSGIRSRRNELSEKGLVVTDKKKIKMPSGRYALTWKVRKK